MSPTSSSSKLRNIRTGTKKKKKERGESGGGTDDLLGGGADDGDATVGARGTPLAVDEEVAGGDGVRHNHGECGVGGVGGWWWKIACFLFLF